MSGALAVANPRRIKAAHRRRRKVASGPIVQRYYDPEVGRFLSVDPVTADGNTGSNFNRYWYANNNPYKFTDPDGRFAFLLPLIPPAVAAAGKAAVVVGAVVSAVAAGYAASEAINSYNESAEPAANSGATENGNTNPYNGPVNEPVVVVDGDGNAIPVGQNEQVTSSPDGRFQQVRDANGQPTGTRLDKGGHPGQADPKAQAPHGHRPGVTDETGNPHLPLNGPVRPEPGF